MAKTGVTHTNTADGKGGGQLSEEKGTKNQKPAPSSGQMYQQMDDKDHGSGKSKKGSGEDL
jgi:hypothetical protein